MLVIPKPKKKLKKRTPRKRIPRGDRLEIGERDLAIFRILCDPHPEGPGGDFGGFRYLTRDFIYALLPESMRGGYYGLRARFTKLLHWSTLAVPPEQRSSPGVYVRKNDIGVAKHTVYEIDPYGAALVGGTRPKYDDPSYPHALLSCFIRAYFQISFNAHPEFRYISFKEILAHPNCSIETREAAQPHVLKIGRKIGPKGTWMEDVIIPDIPIFGVERKRPDGSIGRVFVVVEVDVGGEPQQRVLSKGTDIYDKFLRYNRVLAEKVITRQYGIQSKVLFAFITTKETRCKSLARKVPEHPERFIFDFIQGFDGNEELPRPHEDYLVQKWLTGNGTFSFSDI